MANLRHSAFLKRDSSTGDLSRILRDFLGHLFCIWLFMLYKKSVLKYSGIFTAKFMWTAASGISENRPCLAGCKFINVLQNGL